MTAVNSGKASVVGTTITVTTTAQEITDLLQRDIITGTATIPRPIAIKNPSTNTINVRIGDGSAGSTSPLTTSNGYRLEPGDSFVIDSIQETVWLIAESSTVAIDIAYGPKG